MSRDSCEGDKRKKNNLLTQYYCVDEEKDENKLDIDGKHFSADRYLDKLIRVNPINVPTASPTSYDYILYLCFLGIESETIDR